MDSINQIGATAFIIAAYRAAEEGYTDRLFVDPYAKFFINDEIVKKANDFIQVLPEAAQMIRYRVRFFDDMLASHISQGVTQVVLLGGGFDMRACRYVAPGVRFYDLDQTPVLNFKQQIIDNNNIEYPSVLIGCNYLAGDVIASLTEHGFDSGRSSLFIWEGNTMYLTAEQVYSLLNTLGRQLDRFSICFDYIARSVVTRTSGIASVTNAANFFEDLGSPWITGFDDIKIIEQYTPLRVIDDSLMKHLESKYFPNAEPADPNIMDKYAICTCSNH